MKFSTDICSLRNRIRYTKPKPYLISMEVSGPVTCTTRRSISGRTRRISRRLDILVRVKGMEHNNCKLYILRIFIAESNDKYGSGYKFWINEDQIHVNYH